MSLTLTRRYNADRFGYLIPHRYGNLPMVGAVATYRPGEGRFGRGAVAVEEGTTNYIENPLFENGLSRWAIQNQTGGSDVWVDTMEHPLGDKVVIIEKVEGGGDASPYQSVGRKVTDVHTVSFYAKRLDPSGSDVMRIRYGQSSVTHFVTITDDWKRYSVTFTSEDTGNNNLIFYIYGPAGKVAITGIQVEQKPFATSFVDGTRAAGRLEYPQSIWNHATGTFAAWVKTPTDVSTDRVLTIQWAKDDISAHTRFGIRMNTSGRFVASYGSIDTLTTADSYNDGEWHHVAFTWVDGTADVHLYVDGERVASADSPISVSNPGGRWGGVIPIGHRGYTHNNQWWNGLIDELLILPYAASEEEIVSWYEAQGPLPPHPQALLQWDWQAVTRRHNVDRFGYLIPTQYGNVPMVGAVATYRPGEGKFGRGAVAVEEGTENLIQNGNAEGGYIWWGAYNNGWIIEEQIVKDGKRSFRCNSGNYGGLMSPLIPIDPTKPLCLSFDIYRVVGEGWWTIRWCADDGTVLDRSGNRQITTGPRGVWERRSKIFYPEDYPVGTTKCIILLGRGAGSTYDIIYDNIQLEQKPFATSFVDGTRPDGILAYPLALPENHTIACYRKSHTDEGYRHVVKRSDGKVFVDGVEDSEYDVGWLAGRNLLQDSSLKENSGPFRRNGNVTLSNPDNEFLRVYSNQTTSTPGLIINPYEIPFGTYTLSFDVRGFGGLRQIGIRIYDAMTTLNISENFTRVSATLTLTDDSRYSYFLVFLQPTEVGQGVDIRNIKLEKGNKATDWTPAPEDLGYDGDTLMLSNQTGLIDELLILPYAATEEEINGWYEAQGPLPPHPQAVLQWDWQAVRPAQIVKL